MNKELYFLIGTEAELIKMFPTMLRLNDKKINYKIIATGQNDIKKSAFLKIVNGGQINIDITGQKVTKKNAFNLLKWLITTEINGRKILKEKIKDVNNAFFVIHGDTLSTVIGARLAKALKIPYAHVEAGYRSWNYFCPFPEEFDRTYSSMNADLIFAAGTDLIKNLEKNRGKKINTYYNTSLDSVRYGLKHCSKTDDKEKYFVLSIHRQENLLNKNYLEETIKQIDLLSKKIQCKMFMHPQTKVALKKFQLLSLIENNERIEIYNWMPYFNFLNIINNAEFMITDSISNQQELYYLGKPCLLLRYGTEGNEGLGKNIALFEGDFKKIANFCEEYKKYRREMIETKISPSQIIADELEKVIAK